MDGCVLSRIAAGGQRGGFQETVLGEDARRFLGRGRDEAAARLRHRGKARPAEAGAPQSRNAAVEHHGRSVASLVEEDRLEVLLLVEAEPVDDIAAEDGEARTFGAKGDRLALEVADAARRTV